MAGFTNKIQTWCGITTFWKNRLKLKGLAGLAPYSTAPKRVRSIQVNENVLLFIKSLREKYPNLGKTKVKIILDQFCLQEKLPMYSEAKIGRIIKFYKFFYQKQGRMYHNPTSKYATNRHKTKRLRIKYSPKPTDFGYIQMDTVTRLVDGVKYYFYDAVDTKGKFALSLPYKHLNSTNTVDFMKKLIYVSPSKITTVQTDNGLEFLGEFEKVFKPIETIKQEMISLKDKIEEVLSRISETSASFKNLHKGAKKEIVVLFLAILQLIKDQLIAVEQSSHFEDIIIRKN